MIHDMESLVADSISFCSYKIADHEYHYYSNNDQLILQDISSSREIAILNMIAVDGSSKAIAAKL